MILWEFLFCRKSRVWKIGKIEKVRKVLLNCFDFSNSPTAVPRRTKSLGNIMLIQFFMHSSWHSSLASSALSAAETSSGTVQLRIPSVPSHTADKHPTTA